MSKMKVVTTLASSIAFGALSVVYHPLALAPALVLAFLSGAFLTKMSYEKGRKSLERMTEELDEAIDDLDEYIEKERGNSEL